MTNKRDETHARILDAAERVIQREGLYATTGKVAREAEVSIGTVYNYFRDMVDIYGHLGYVLTRLPTQMTPTERLNILRDRIGDDGVYQAEPMAPSRDALHEALDATKILDGIRALDSDPRRIEQVDYIRRMMREAVLGRDHG